MCAFFRRLLAVSVVASVLESVLVSGRFGEDVENDDGGRGALPEGTLRAVGGGGGVSLAASGEAREAGTSESPRLGPPTDDCGVEETLVPLSARAVGLGAAAGDTLARAVGLVRLGLEPVDAGADAAIFCVLSLFVLSGDDVCEGCFDAEIEAGVWSEELGGLERREIFGAPEWPACSALAFELAGSFCGGAEADAALLAVARVEGNDALLCAFGLGAEDAEPQSRQTCCAEARCVDFLPLASSEKTAFRLRLRFVPPFGPLGSALSPAGRGNWACEAVSPGRQGIAQDAQRGLCSAYHPGREYSSSWASSEFTLPLPLSLLLPARFVVCGSESPHKLWRGRA